MPKPGRDDVLRNLDPGRRKFIKGLIAATSFTAPLIASFSLDSLSIDSAEAYHLSNQCSEATSYVGPRNFLATLWGTGTLHHGTAELKVTERGTSVRFRLKFSRRVHVVSAHIVLAEDGEALAGVIFFGTPSGGDVLANLVGTKGKIEHVADPTVCSFEGMLQEMAAGHTLVKVTTTGGGVIQGQLVPQGGSDD